MGAFEAKTKLSELLERVQRGESFTITKHDRPVALLSAYASEKAGRCREAAVILRRLRHCYTLGGVDVRELREEGRP